ncbi:hypothetical protein ACFXG4_39940 [Nocardia sp. NPDC059246]|uniref:hypothetical protein n=1 Tax=unclassified Nocardia TaxID=2637762 RepID=UPI0036BC8D38
MTRFVTWIRLNIDGVVTLVVAATAIVVEAFDKFANLNAVSGATLLVLSLLALTLLRDRNRTSRLVRELAAVRLLHGAEIDQAHAQARRDTDNWIYKGGTGTYLRAVTLPYFPGRARDESHLLNLRVEVLDPGNEQLCLADAQYRNSLQPQGDASGRPWTADRIRKQSYATALACAWYRQQSEFLTIELGLSSTLSTYRWDMSDRNRRMGTRTAWVRQNSRHSSVAREAHGVITGPALVPISKASNWFRSPGEITASPAV